MPLLRHSALKGSTLTNYKYVIRTWGNRDYLHRRGAESDFHLDDYVSPGRVETT